MISLVPGNNALAKLFGLGETKLDPDTFLSAITVAGIVQGSLLMFAPNLSRRMWGIKDKSIYTIAHLEYIGAGLLSMGVTCLCLFIVGGFDDTHKIVGWTLGVWALENASALIKHYPSRAGGDPTGQVLWLFLIFEAIRACFVSSAYTQQLLLAAYSLNALNNFVAVVKPRTSANIYGYEKIKLNNDQLSMLRGFGYENLAMCTFLLSLLNGVEAPKALGFASMVIVVHCADGLVGKINSSIGNSGSIMFFFWMFFHASCAANFVSRDVSYLMVGVTCIVTAMKVPSVLRFLLECPPIAEEELFTKYSWWWKEAHMGIGI